MMALLGDDAARRAADTAFMNDDSAGDPVARALVLLDRPAEWPVAAATLYAPTVRWQAPARALVVEGRRAVLAQLQADAERLAAAQCVLLRRALAGPRVIDESALSFVCPAGGIPGVPLKAGDRVELKRTRLLSFAGGLIVDEMNLETWTLLESPSELS